VEECGRLSKQESCKEMAQLTAESGKFKDSVETQRPQRGDTEIAEALELREVNGAEIIGRAARGVSGEPCPECELSNAMLYYLMRVKRSNQNSTRMGQVRALKTLRLFGVFFAV
jgi:hypothetical protein